MTLTDLRKSKGLLIDTNLLVLWVIGSIDSNQIQYNNLTSSYTADDYDLLLRLIDAFPKTLVVTPHILTEASNLLAKISFKDVHALAVLEKIAAIISEKPVDSLETMQRFNRSFIKFGLTDAVIHSLAQENYAVLTQDLRLCYYLQSLGCQAINFNNLRSVNLLR